ADCRVAELPLRFIPNINYGTEKYPEKVARRLRAVNITAWFAAGVTFVTAVIERALLDPTPGRDNEWTYILISFPPLPILLAVPLLHRFGPLAAPVFGVLIAYAFIFTFGSILGTGTALYLGFFNVTALGILFVGPEYVWLTVTFSLVAVGLIIVLHMTVPP